MYIWSVPNTQSQIVMISWWLISITSNHYYGQLTRWHRWSACDVGEVIEGLKNECDVGEAMEGLENELWCRWSEESDGEWGSASQLIRQHTCHFTYITAHSPTLLSLHLCMSQLTLQPFCRFTYITRWAARDHYQVHCQYIQSNLKERRYEFVERCIDNTSFKKIISSFLQIGLNIFVVDLIMITFNRN